ncbi:cation diffusion facilitator family transporter [Coprobacter tertius]|uniref:Cation diffusion facilitator family transporter n=1 Tax=Coprobacter tertius TaxID=2944915 RepID=A0ABT1MG96_9BACT|nr:cation diffusion facilitator family transporter [Coprobacter tertius]MCP9611647.1 cation diffusion facilitator family transporter [Coprobacter tertius]
MAHQHEHHHHAHIQDMQKVNKAFIVGIVLNTIFVGVEAAAGFWFDSLALLSDAGHNLSDVVSLILAMLAFRLMRVKPNDKYTYGYKKSTVLVSLLNAIILLVAVGMILGESINKIRNPQPVDGNAIAWVAGVGIVINAFTALLLFREKGQDLNVKGAYLHMAADTLVSVGVLVSGLIIQHTGWYLIDPLIGIIVAIVILVSTWGLLHDSIRLSLDGVPVGIDVERVKKTILKNPLVKGVHHMHIWALSTTENALTAHVVVDSAKDMENLKCELKHELKEENIQHATLEIELKGAHCDGTCCE